MRRYEIFRPGLEVILAPAKAGPWIEYSEIDWRNIEDEKPKEGQLILGLWYYPKGDYVKNIKAYEYYEKYYSGNLNYWKPLCEPPHKKEEKSE